MGAVPRPAAAVVAEMFERRAAGDVQGVLDLIDPEMEASTLGEGGRVFRGHEGVRDYFRSAMCATRQVETPIHELVAIDEERAVGVGRLRIRDVGAGISDAPGAWTFKVRAGKIVRVDAFRSKRDALAAA